MARREERVKKKSKMGRPRQDPKTVRVTLVVRVHPVSAKLIKRLAKRLKCSRGQMVDGLVTIAQLLRWGA